MSQDFDIDAQMSFYPSLTFTFNTNHLIDVESMDLFLKYLDLSSKKNLSHNFRLITPLREIENSASPFEAVSFSGFEFAT